MATVGRPAPLHLILLLAFCGLSSGLGGYRHRNRQNQNSAYFGYGHRPPFREFPERENDRAQEVLEALLAEQEATSESSCFGRRCTVTDKCCPGTVCVDMDEYVGTCLPTYGARKGEPCRHDDDCAPGLFCAEGNDNGLMLRTCQSDRHSLLPKKQYSDHCEVSAECDLNKGLCCQIQRRHRQAPRKVCIYYKDPSNCLGSMEGAPPPPPQDLNKVSPLKSRLG